MRPDYPLIAANTIDPMRGSRGVRVVVRYGEAIGDAGRNIVRHPERSIGAKPAFFPVRIASDRARLSTF